MKAGFTRRVAAVGVILALMGCNGLPGTPEPEGTEPPSTMPTLTTSAIRLLEPGDAWTYRERGALSLMGYTVEFTIDLTNTILADTVSDKTGTRARVMAKTDEFRFVGDAQTWSTSSSQVYFTQAQDGTLFFHGEYDDLVQPAVRRFVTKPVTGCEVMMPSPLSAGSPPVNTSIGFDDGATEDGHITPVAVESVSVPAGQFAAVRVCSAGTRTTGAVKTNFVITSWYVPELGADVKTESTVTTQDYASGDTVTTTSVRELVNTTVELGR